MKMKRIRRTFGMCLGVSGAALATLGHPTAELFAATTGNVTIQGAISAATAIVVTAQTGYNALDLTSVASDQVVATVREINNTTAGYGVTLTSTNAGNLKNGTLGQVPYTAKYNGTAVTLSTSPQTITTQGTQTAIVNTVKNFAISFAANAAEDLMVGTYSDTLTFTISAN